MILAHFRGKLIKWLKDKMCRPKTTNICSVLTVGNKDNFL